MDNDEKIGLVKEIKGKLTGKDKYFLVFGIVTLLVFIATVLNFLKINLGQNIISNTINMLPSWILFIFLLVLIFSTVCAYYKKYTLMFIPILLWLMFATAFVRTTNIPDLKDVTTKDWTLGPDLDPFLYLRHAYEINNGTLQNPDLMRNFPFGAHNYAYTNLMPWAIIILFKLISIFSTTSITYAAIIAPVIFFLLSLIGFFLFNKTIFATRFSRKMSTSIALVASFMYAALPEMLHRTVAGIPEIESLGMVWFWFAFLFFVMAWKSESNRKSIIYGIIAGIFTGLMSWTWGGYRYIHLAISLCAFVLFIIQKDKKKNFAIFLSFAITSLIIEFTKGDSLVNILTRVSDTGFTAFVVFIILFDRLISSKKIREWFKLDRIKLPESITSLILGLVLLVLIIAIVSPGFLADVIPRIIESLLYPFGQSRVGLTVAENKAPYFVETLADFGNLFWMFLVGIVILFWDSLIELNKKKKIILTLAFVLLVSALTFTRISSTSPLNGENFISDFLYLGGIVLFLLVLFYVIYKSQKNDPNTIEGLKKVDVGFILVLSLSFFSLISIRGAVRLFFMVSPIVAIIASFLPFRFLKSLYSKRKDELMKIFLWVCLIVALIFLFMAYVKDFQETAYETKGTIPSSYTQQWQKAMGWVRENTTEGSVFVHWWDYGYWVQTIGERPTVTDGGHFIGYWNYLVGRYLLTTPKPETALSFMKTHNVSYLLIDSSDIGKYSAFSSIGNGKTSDRLSWIPTMLSDQSQTQEKANSTIRIYQGGSAIDQDIVYDLNGQQIFLPEGKAGIGGVVIETKKDTKGLSFTQPQAVFVYNNNQVRIPIRYIYYEHQLFDFKTGLNSTAYIFPLINQNSQQYQMDEQGALMYLSERVTNSLMAQLYLLDDAFKNYPTIKLAHTETDPFIEFADSQGATLGDFVYFGGVRGPIKIWKVDYPSNTLVKEEFLAKDGGYGDFDNLTFTR